MPGRAGPRVIACDCELTSLRSEVEELSDRLSALQPRNKNHTPFEVHKK